MSTRSAAALCPFITSPAYTGLGSRTGQLLAQKRGVGVCVLGGGVYSPPAHEHQVCSSTLPLHHKPSIHRLGFKDRATTSSKKGCVCVCVCVCWGRVYSPPAHEHQVCGSRRPLHHKPSIHRLGLAVVQLTAAAAVLVTSHRCHRCPRRLHCCHCCRGGCTAAITLKPSGPKGRVAASRVQPQGRA
jgi:hypothetical protein